MDRSSALPTKGPDRATLALAAMAGPVSVASLAAPGRLLRLFGVPADELTGATSLGWRLFGVRTGWVVVQSLRGDASATAAYLPLQVADQFVFWQAFATRSVPRRTSVLAAATSGVLVALDLRRRAGAGATAARRTTTTSQPG